MNVPRLFFVFAIAAATAAGCGAPEPKHFADGELTKELNPKAAKVVRDEVDSQFGTPANHVASMAFSDAKGNTVVHFGRIEGEVLAAEEPGLERNQLRVSLKGDQDVKPQDLIGLGVLWTKGKYQYAEAVPKDQKKHGDKPVSFHVIGFTPEENGTGVLSFNHKFEEGNPPAKADTFEIVGHRLVSGRQLYAQHCMHCHGASGDGKGPTAKYLNPLPRDYRLGIFKFTSTKKGDKASRNDLKRTVKLGIPGTYMPSFLLLEDKELDNIIEYVRFLSLRGEYEQEIAKGFVVNDLYVDFSKRGWKQQEAAAQNSEKPGPEENLQQYVNELLNGSVQRNTRTLTTNWLKSDQPDIIVRPETPRIDPVKDPQSIARGRALYLSSTTLCWSCHGKSGKGDGYQTTDYLKNAKDVLAGGAPYPEPGLHDDWGNVVKPRNLTTGIYRGGRRPIDLYRRIRAGIKGTPMPPFSTLKDEQVWDLVNYVLAVPHLADGTMTMPSAPSDKKEERKDVAQE